MEVNLMRSMEFWKTRYELGDTSGSGSRGDLLNFKTEFINDFIKENDITTVLDFGYGDLYVAKEINVEKYTGIDIFEVKDKDDFNLLNCEFDEYDGDGADLVMCLDVLYHILEEEQEYMRDSLDKMMEKTDKFLMIYAHDSEDERFETEYSVHLYNSKWLQHMKTREDFELIYKQERPEPNCSAQFYIFERK